jgi:superfamily II DNA or RNA helicase|tara:strand:- start:1198 stop:2541 length:1344 start_codon:yes stop_codon:yes gene_type:complete
MNMYPPFKHQKVTTDFIKANPRCLITSDPGTGKTRSVLDAIVDRKSRTLVLAPLSILEASWADDILKFTPDLTYAVAYAKNREKAFASDAKVVITNHDAVKWILKNLKVLRDFDTLVIDEFTAFKNANSQRSKACRKLSELFTNRIAMSGTPNSNGILDLWHPALIVDDGERLGRRFYSFRGSVCTPRFNGFANEWVQKDNAEETVAAALSDINVRYMLEECLDMPAQTVSTMYVTLPKKIMEQYKTLSDDSVLYTGETTINALHAGSKVKKLLQLCTGAVYDSEGTAQNIHKERYEVVMQLVAERAQSLVAFNWKHEQRCLVELADKMGIKHATIDGSVAAHKRKEIVDRLQAGELQVVFCHPQSAGHGLTMTTAKTVIWASPTYNAEHYQQFNRRIYRAGQTEKTEVIQIAARDTWETDVYEKLQGKVERMDELLGILNQLRHAA